MSSFYSEQELEALGLARFGKNVQLSRKASIYNPKGISIGNFVRIDDFCVLSAGDGGISIGDYCHISVFCSLIGSGRIVIGDFCGLSGRVSVYSSTDDFSGNFLVTPTVPKCFTGVEKEDVTLVKHCIVGAGSVVLPGVVLEEGVAIGALSLVNRDCSAFGIFAGVPARFIKGRRRDLLTLEKLFTSACLSRKNEEPPSLRDSQEGK